MKFSYARIPSAEAGGRDAWRPLVKARIFGPKRTLRVDMLVDSGSDESMVPRSILEAVGASFTGESVELVGMGGAKQVGHVAAARVEVAGHTYDAQLVGVDGPVQLSLLGQRDFFANFVVQFDRASKLFFVTPVRARG